MTDQEPVDGNVSRSGSNGTENNEGSGLSSVTSSASLNEDKHVVRILGTYSLLEFFTHEGQKRFFDAITDPAFEAIFLRGEKCAEDYAKDTDSFRVDAGEKEFELKMTNLGFIREAFWKESFPPIFSLNTGKEQEVTRCWSQFPPKDTRDKFNYIVRDRTHDEFPKAFLYHYALCKLGEEFRKVIEESGELKIHIGLNKFGIANVGITIEFERQEAESFGDLCKRAYRKVAHLQEDPLKNLKNDLATYYGGSDIIQQTLNRLEHEGNYPRLTVSYFQVLAITTIHKFLHEQLKRNTITGFFECWLAEPWVLSNQISDSTRKGLPPLRHVVFIYQLVHLFYRKETFLNHMDNKLALLTLGHNVGWSPSWNSPFPLFTSTSSLLDDSSLLENSSCFIFPQGLVVVHSPNQFVYPGGCPENNSSTEVPYHGYWRLIFKLFIRVVEARLLIGMVNSHLSDIHKDFLDFSQLGWWRKLICWTMWLMPIPKCVRSWALSFLRIKTTLQEIYSQLMHVGLIIQRTSGRVIGPEVTRYSFVRKKLTSFTEGVNFEEHGGYIQSEYEKLNRWLDAAMTTAAARLAIIVSFGAFVASVVIGGWQIYKSYQDDVPHQAIQEKIKVVEAEIGELKMSTGDVNSEHETLERNVGGVIKKLESLSRQLSASQKETPPSDGKKEVKKTAQ